jgi:PAS domain S-box-containing protein
MEVREVEGRMKGPRIRTHFLLLFLATSILPILALFSLLQWGLMPRLAVRERERLAAGAAQLALLADQKISSHLQSLQMLAATGVPTQEQLSRAHALRPEFITMLAATAQGQIVASSPALDASALRRAERVLPERDYLRTPIETGWPFVSGAFLGEGFGNDPIVAISAPVAGGEAIVQASLHLERFSEEMQEAASQWGVSLLLTDHEGRVVLGDRGGIHRPLSQLSKTELGQTAAKTGPGNPFLLGDEPGEHLGGAQVVYAPLPQGGWNLYAIQDRRVLRAQMATWVRVLLATWLLIGLLILLLALTSAWWVTAPIRRLHLLAVRLKSMDAEDSLLLPRTGPGRVEKLRAPREVTELGDAFRSMAAHLHRQNRELREHREHLEHRVSERTALLEQANALYRREAEQRRQAQFDLELRDRAIEESHEGIVILSAGGGNLGVVYANRGFEEITGYSAAEVMGRNLRFLQGPKRDEAARALLREAIANVRSCSVEILNYRKTGEPFWSRLSISPIEDDTGQVTHWVGIKVDITASKELDRLKSELVATVSHELRTPMTSIRGFAELRLAREFPREKQRRYLTIMQEESARLGRLIDDFLDLQRIESGRQQYKFEDGCIGEVLRRSIAVFEGAPESHQFRLKLPESLPRVRFDPERMQQVMANLLSNAVKYSAPATAIEIRAEDDEGGVRISVRDRGAGIPPRAIPRLFTRFYRVDQEASRRTGGTGLGLELVKRMVEAHGGQVGVESTVGEGSTFYFTLPAVGVTERVSVTR